MDRRRACQIIAYERSMMTRACAETITSFQMPVQGTKRRKSKQHGCPLLAADRQASCRNSKEFGWYALNGRRIHRKTWRPGYGAWFAAASPSKYPALSFVVLGCVTLPPSAMLSFMPSTGVPTMQAIIGSQSYFFTYRSCRPSLTRPINGVERHGRQHRYDRDFHIPR